MTSAELCLSFDRSMEFTKRGIIFVGSCFCWVMDNDDQQVKLIEASRMMDILDLKGEVCFLSHAPTAGELEEWLMNKPPFSKRVWSIHIAVVAEMAEDGTWKRLYRVAADCGDGSEMCKLVPAPLDALAALALEVAG